MLIFASMKTDLFLSVVLLTTVSCGGASSEYTDHNTQSEIKIELAATAGERAEQQLVHQGYVASYNSDWLVSNWVAYDLTAAEVAGTYKRPKGKSFEPDPQASGASAQHADYSRQRPYVRGHLAPAADMKWSEQAMNESFYLSNVVPQDSALNDGMWERLERKVRELARRDSVVYICTGPVMDAVPQKIGRNGVAVPVGLFKVLCRQHQGKWCAIGFLFPNQPCEGSIFDYATSVDEVEWTTGHDFFFNLPDDVEEEIESNFDIKDWQ